MFHYKYKMKEIPFQDQKSYVKKKSLGCRVDSFVQSQASTDCSAGHSPEEHNERTRLVLAEEMDICCSACFSLLLWCYLWID